MPTIVSGLLAGCITLNKQEIQVSRDGNPDECPISRELQFCNGCGIIRLQISIFSCCYDLHSEESWQVRIEGVAATLLKAKAFPINVATIDWPDWKTKGFFCEKPR